MAHKLYERRHTLVGKTLLVFAVLVLAFCAWLTLQIASRQVAEDLAPWLLMELACPFMIVISLNLTTFGRWR